MDKLSKEDKELYKKIKEYGDMDDMFKFAYMLGKLDEAKERLQELGVSF